MINIIIIRLAWKLKTIHLCINYKYELAVHRIADLIDNSVLVEKIMDVTHMTYFRQKLILILFI